MNHTTVYREIQILRSMPEKLVFTYELRGTYELLPEVEFLPDNPACNTFNLSFP